MEITKKIFMTIALTGALATTTIAQEVDSDDSEINFLEIVTTDLDLTPAQEAEMMAINTKTYQKVLDIKARYKTDDEVYSNRVRTIYEKRDAELQEVMTLEQYAIYLNNIRGYQDYEVAYEDGGLELYKEEDGGTIKAKTDEGRIKINDDKIIIKNTEEETKLKIKDDKVKYKSEDGKVKIKDDKVKVKSENGSSERKVKIKDDKAKIKTDEMKLKIKEANENN